jgi:quercetin dioxygenase-like cupin family protein
MTPAPDRHDSTHSELVCLYVLQALPPPDVASAAAQIDACADCRHEAEALRPVLQAFAAWPADVLRPPTPLWDRLARRLALDADHASVAPAPPRSRDPDWREVAPGISCKLLATDRARQRVSMLVRLAPGTDYPPHRHAGVEELHMLDGELIVDGQTFHPGDYRRAEPGALDHRVWSETGCTCVLVTSFHDVLL